MATINNYNNLATKRYNIDLEIESLTNVLTRKLIELLEIDKEQLQILKELELQEPKFNSYIIQNYLVSKFAPFIKELNTPSNKGIIRESVSLVNTDLMAKDKEV